MMSRRVVDEICSENEKHVFYGGLLLTLASTKLEFCIIEIHVIMLREITIDI